MASPAQIAANRRNALKSTGPITAQGKAVASLNACKHGLRSKSIVLPGEDPQKFAELLAALRTEHQPGTPAEESCVIQMAAARWKILRALAQLDRLKDKRRFPYKPNSRGPRFTRKPLRPLSILEFE